MFNRHILVCVVFTECRIYHRQILSYKCDGLSRALISKLPLTLGPYPTQFYDGPLGPLFILGMPLSQGLTLRDHKLLWTLFNGFDHVLGIEAYEEALDY